MYPFFRNHKRLRYTELGPAVLALWAISLFGQSSQGPPPRAVAPLPSYIGQGLVPSTARDYVIALGDRIQKPGKERLTLAGVALDSKYGTTSARLVWELPGRLRFDRTGGSGSPPPLIFDSNMGLTNASTLPDADLAVLESLVSDSVEAFLYGFVQGHAHRFLGGRFRTDNGKNPTYAGPWYDIYEAVAPPQGPPGAPPPRPKWFWFDSEGKLLIRTTYLASRGGAQIQVSTEFNKWTASAGQATPGQIVRNENGAAVFTFNIASATVGPAANDGLFPGH